MPLQPLEVRVSAGLPLDKIDDEWFKHKLPTDDIYIPPKQVPDADAEVNYLLEANDSWRDARPANFCFQHRHWAYYA